LFSIPPQLRKRLAIAIYQFTRLRELWKSNNHKKKHFTHTMMIITTVLKYFCWPQQTPNITSIYPGCFKQQKRPFAYE
jgi:hypothetical protein